MNRFFPNIESAIIAVFLLCAALWGFRKCSSKKDDLAIRAASGAMALPDTLISPAAAKPKPALPDPNLTTTSPPPQYSTTPPANPGQALPQPVPQQSLPNPNTTITPTVAPKIPPKTPNVATTTVVESAPNVQQSTGSALYVLRNGLNVRSQPSVKSKSLGRLKLNDQVYFMEEVSQNAETVRLENGTEITKPWFKIKTKKGTVGWVHGSGVDFYKRKPQDVL